MVDDLRAAEIKAGWQLNIRVKNTFVGVIIAEKFKKKKLLLLLLLLFY